MALSTFLRAGVHQFAVILAQPELIRIRYVDAIPLSEAVYNGTILLIHGWPQTSYQFRHVIPLLTEAGYRVIAPDYRGSGESSKPMNLDGYRKKSLATDLNHLLYEHLNIMDKVHVVGHDIGGMIAYAFASSYLFNTASVTWGECSLPGTSHFENTRDRVNQFHFNFHRTPDLPETLVQVHERAYLKHFFDKNCYNAAAITPDDLEYYVQQFSQPGGTRGSINVYRKLQQDAVDNKVVRERKGKCGVRCFILHGLYTPLVNIVPVDQVKNLYGNVETAVVYQAGHYIAEENPHHFVEQILKFIEKS